MDPLAMDYPYKSSYDYAENTPVRFIDLDGLERAESPWLRSGVSLNINAGQTGVEVKALGAKVGLTAYTASQSILGYDGTYNNVDGGESTFNYGYEGAEKLGLSGGDVVGGELSIEMAGNTKKTINAKVNLGLFYIKNETIITQNGGESNHTYLGVELGGSAGIVYSADGSVFVEISIDPDTNEEEAKPTEYKDDMVAPSDALRYSQPPVLIKE